MEKRDVVVSHLGSGYQMPPQKSRSANYQNVHKAKMDSSRQSSRFRRSFGGGGRALGGRASGQSRFLVALQLFGDELGKPAGELLHGAGHGFLQLFDELLVPTFDIELLAFGQDSPKLFFKFTLILKKLWNVINRQWCLPTSERRGPQTHFCGSGVGLMKPPPHNLHNSVPYSR